MRIGLIAGGGQFPLIFSKTATSKGYNVYAVAFRNETDSQLADCVNGIEWIHLGQLRRLIKFFKKNDVRDAVMLGTIKKTRLFTDVKPDIRAISLVLKMRHTHDDGMLRAVAAELEKEGIQIQPSTFLLPELLASEGCWTTRQPTRSEKSDAALGWKLAKEIGRLDIGQCVVVVGGSVLAVEAIEGTDAAIKRGGEFAEGGVVVKVCKPNQDTRFDIPAVGAQTIETMHAADARVLVIEAEKAVVFDRDEMISLANRHGISVVAMKNNPDDQ